MLCPGGERGVRALAQCSESPASGSSHRGTGPHPGPQTCRLGCRAVLGLPPFQSRHHLFLLLGTGHQFPVSFCLVRCCDSLKGDARPFLERAFSIYTEKKASFTVTRVNSGHTWDPFTFAILSQFIQEALHECLLDTRHSVRESIKQSVTSGSSGSSQSGQRRGRGQKMLLY